MAKFSKRAFKKWLDCLAAVIVKTDDNFTCQIKMSKDCAGVMHSLDRNCQWCHIKSRSGNNLRWDTRNAITGCGACHKWAHDNPNEFGVWFADNYPQRNEYLNEPRITKNRWKKEDFVKIETKLLQEALDVGVDYMSMMQSWNYRQRLKQKLADLKGITMAEYKIEITVEVPEIATFMEVDQWAKFCTGYTGSLPENNPIYNSRGSDIEAKSCRVTRYGG